MTHPIPPAHLGALGLPTASSQVLPVPQGDSRHRGLSLPHPCLLQAPELLTASHWEKGKAVWASNCFQHFPPSPHAGKMWLCQGKRSLKLGKS